MRTLPHAHVPSIEEELDEYLMLREVNNSGGLRRDFNLLYVCT